MEQPAQLTGIGNLVRRVIFLCAGSVILLGAIMWGVSIRRFAAQAASAQGVVSKLNAGGSHPEIRFTTPNGRVIDYAQDGLIRRLQGGRCCNGVV